MVKLLLIIPFLIFFSCGKNESEDPVSDLDNMKEKDRIYQALVGDDPYRLTTPGDALTFVGLFATVRQWRSLYDHYWNSRWNRNVYDVYANGESRSGISLEGMLSAINFLLAMSDVAGIEDIYQYGQDNDWVYGDGPEEYTRLPQLEYLLADFCENNLVERQSLTMTELKDLLKGYKGNVIGLWIATKGRLYGYIRDIELRLVRELIDAEPSNPIYHTLLHRYTDGDHSTAISILSNDQNFPADRIPIEPLELFAWNDAPPAILYSWTVFLMGD
jgi:hypothetical protein